jgi:hypothetical protein
MTQMETSGPNRRCHNEVKIVVFKRVEHVLGSGALKNYNAIGRDQLLAILLKQRSQQYLQCGALYRKQ